MNRAIIVGRLGKDPELKDIKGTSLCSFSVATSEKWKDKNGQAQERTEWHNIKVFGPMADNCHKYLKKGSQVLVEGKIQTRSYEKDGDKKYITEILASSVQFLDPKNDAQTQDDLPF